MNIEKILLASGISSFDRIRSFLEKLYIKNEAEAKLTESLESLSTYEKYRNAFEKTDSFVDYTYSDTLLETYGFNIQERLIYIDPDMLDQLLYKKDNRCLSLLSFLRLKRINEYVEYNSYYRTFLGLPKSEKEYVQVFNNDKVSPLDPEIIYLHEVGINSYPRTYNRLFVKNEINVIMQTFDYEYLQFVRSPMNVYEIHQAGQYDILHYPITILEESELTYFFKSYNEIKQQILEIDYIQGFGDNYYEYSLLMLSFILYGTFIQFYNKMIERYSMRMYTEDEIYDVLDSNGLSSLKRLNLSLLRKVVDRLPDLKSTRGTNKVIDIIFDIVADKSLAIKRYYLTKKYNTDAQGSLSIDSESTYDASVDLSFIERTVKAGIDAISTTDLNTDYHEFIKDDDTWGGVIDIDNQETKYAIREALRKRILQLDFSSLITKYISVSKIINMYTKLISLMNYLGLLYQFNNEHDNFMETSDTLFFKGIEVSPIAIFSAWCWAYAKQNGVTNPSFIVTQASTIYDIMRLRNSDGLVQEVDDLGNTHIDLGNGYTKKLSQIIQTDEIRNLLVSFNYDEQTSLMEILSQYEINAVIVERIKDKLTSVTTTEEYNSWKLLYNANIISYRSESLFEGYSTHEEYLYDIHPTFYNYIEPIINGDSFELLNDLAIELGQMYSDYINDITEGLTAYYTNENEIIGGENIDDIIILLNSFMSIFTQIYKTDFHIGYDDQLKNSLKFLYTYMKMETITGEQELAFLKYKNIDNMLYQYNDTDVALQLIHEIDELLYNDNEFFISLSYVTLGTLIENDYNELLPLFYNRYIDTLMGSESDTLSPLQYVANEITT